MKKCSHKQVLVLIIVGILSLMMTIPALASDVVSTPRHIGTVATYGEDIFTIWNGDLYCGDQKIVIGEITWVIRHEDTLFWSKLEGDESNIYYRQLLSGREGILYHAPSQVESFDVLADELYYLHDGSLIRVNLDSNESSIVSSGNFEQGFYFTPQGNIEYVEKSYADLFPEPQEDYSGYQELWIPELWDGNATLFGNSVVSVDFISNSSKRQYIENAISHYLENYPTLTKTLRDSKPVVFFFEGGSDNCDSVGYNWSRNRTGAVCIVIRYRSGTETPYIAYHSENCSTLPDYPLGYGQYSGNGGMGSNYGTATLIDGIYELYSVNHKGDYASYQVRQNGSAYVPAIYMKNDGSYSHHNASGIHTHTRTMQNVSSSPSSPWSAGCILIGASTPFNEYNAYVEEINGGSGNLSTTTYRSNSIYKFSSTGNYKSDIVFNRFLAQEELSSLYRNSKAIEEITSFSPKTFANPSVDVADGTYMISSALMGKALDISGAEMEPGANLQLWRNLSIDSQKFRITRNGDYYTMVARHSGMALDVAGAVSASGTNVYQWPLNGNDAQNWKFEDAGDGYVYIRSALGYYLDVCNGASDDGTNVWTYTFNGGMAQKFKLYSTSDTPLVDVPNGTYMISSALMGKALDISGAEMEPGANLQLWRNLSIDSQKFRITRNGDYYTMVARHSGMALDVAGAVSASETNVYQWPLNGNDAQNWKFEDAGDGYVYIRSALGYYLDVCNGASDDGTNVWTYTFNGGMAQKFKLYSTSDTPLVDVPNGTYMISSALMGKVLDISGAEMEQGANLQLWRNLSIDSQKFRITRNGDYYTMVARHSDMALDVAGAVSASETNVYQWPLNGNDAQNWKFEDAGDGYVYIRSALGYYLDVCGGASDDGTNVWTYTFNGGMAQKFKLYSTSDTPLVDVPNGTYMISSALMGKVLDISGAEMEQGANLQLWRNLSIDSQKFRITRNGDYYTMVARHSGMALDVTGGVSASGTNVYQWPLNGNDAQNWKFEDAGDGYVYIRSALGYYLDVCNGVPDDGTNVWTYDFNGSTAQKFRLMASYTVTYNANGGIVSPANKLVIVGETYGDLPTPSRQGYNFDGWYTAMDNGDKITRDSKVSVSENHTLYAQWTKQPSSSTQILIGNASATQGTTVDMSVTIQNNPGIAGAVFALSYDKSILTLDDITKGSVFAIGNYTSNSETGVVSWYHTEDTTNNGVLFTLRFTVNANAQDGNYNIDIGLHDGKTANLSNANSEIVNAEFISGILEVKASSIFGDVTGDGVVAINDVVKLARAVAGSLTLTEAEKTVADLTGDGVIAINDVVKLARYVAGNIASLQSAEVASLSGGESAVIEVATVSGNPSETVRIPVSVINNPGIAGAQLDILFDSGLTLKNIIQGDVLSAGTFNPDISNGRIQWYYDQANVTNTGVLFTLEFEVSAEAQNGDAYAVTVNVKDGITANLSDYDFNPVNAEFKPGKVQIDETSDSTAINTVSRNGNTITANVVCADSNASVFCAVYNNSGKMIAVRSVQITGESNYQFQFDGQQFDYAKAFIVDGNFRPLCESKKS